MENRINKLIKYIEILNEWNERLNLVSYKSIKEFLIDHIIDSFSIMELLNFKNLKIGDVGTGPGLPGIILSILLPFNRFVLIEPKKKYYRFQNISIMENVTLTSIHSLKTIEEFIG